MLHWRRTLPALLSLTALPAAAQQALLFAPENDELLLDNAGGLVEAGTLRPDEVGVFVPGSGAARPFLPTGSQWAYLGDADSDGRLVDTSTSAPGEDVDAVFVKRFLGAPTGPLGPREVFVSKEDVSGFAPGLEDGDVFRYSDQGLVEFFVTEAQLLSALGQEASGELDLDAICQNATGDLYLSFGDTELVNGVSALDGAVVIVPSAALTYDAQGNVSAVAAGSASVLFDETLMRQFVTNSGMATSVGGTPSADIDISALEVDPDHSVPGGETHLWFAWSGFSNDGAVLTTFGGGQAATLSGAPLASAVATTGTQLGLLPDSTGLDGLGGLALAPFGARQLCAENYPTNLITTSTVLFTRCEVTGATAGQPVVFFVDFGPLAPGSSLPALSLPLFDGQLFGTGTVLVTGTGFASPLGVVGNALVLPSSTSGSGLNLVFQAVDVITGRLASPAAMQFL
jgi:hypothetical protein